MRTPPALSRSVAALTVTPMNWRNTMARSFAVAALAALVGVPVSPAAPSAQQDSSAAAPAQITHRDLVPRVEENTFLPMRRTFAPLCTGTGTDGYRIHVVYAYTSSTNNLALEKARILTSLYEADDLLADAAWNQRTPLVRLRIATDSGQPGCKPLIHMVRLPDEASSLEPEWAIDAIQGEPELSLLLNQGRTRLLVLNRAPQAQKMCGMAYAGESLDDPYTWFAMASCNDGATYLHELFHTMGAVDTSARNATSMHHCNQYSDLMCSYDGSGAKMVRGACKVPFGARVDCGADMYFNLNGTVRNDAGSEVINVARSAYLEKLSTYPSPPSQLIVSELQRPTYTTRTVTAKVVLPPGVSAKLHVYPSNGCSFVKALSAGTTTTLKLRSSCLTSKSKQVQLDLVSSAKEVHRVMVKLSWRS